MPMRMIGKDGRILSGYYCAKNSPAEVKTIIEMGIKKGVCSLRRVTMQIVSGESSSNSKWRSFVLDFGKYARISNNRSLTRSPGSYSEFSGRDWPPWRTGYFDAGSGCIIDSTSSPVV